MSRDYFENPHYLIGRIQALLQMIHENGLPEAAAIQRIREAIREFEAAVEKRKGAA